MREVGLVYSREYQKHHTYAHPESPLRMERILDLLEKSPLLNQVVKINPKPIDIEYLQLNHYPDYINHVMDFAQTGKHIDTDTQIYPGSYEIALLAAGGVIEGLNSIVEGKVKKCFALVRPPGHHAMPDHSMGFCLFDNIAVGAKYLLRNKGFKRIMIIDWDVHHGNGTEAAFYDTSDVLFVSWHQHKGWPFTSGYASSTGAEEGEGYNINIPLPAASGINEYMETFNEIVKPAAIRYNPEIIMISCGYDAHFLDPIGNMNLTVKDYGHLTKQISELADDLCDGKLMTVLEGGYNLDVVAHSVLATLTVMLDKNAEVTDSFNRPPKYKVDIKNLIKDLKSRTRLLL